MSSMTFGAMEMDRFNNKENEMSDKKYVYLPVELANKVESINSDAELSVVIDKYFENSMKEIKAQLEALDDSVLQYKGLMAKARQGFNDAADEMIEKSYKAWEEYDEKLHTPLHTKVKKTRQLLEPLKKDLQEVGKLLRALDLYQLEKLLSMLREINELKPKTVDTLALFMRVMFEDKKE